MNWKSLAVALVIIVPGCATTEQSAGTRANTNLDTRQMMGPDSSEWDEPLSHKRQGSLSDLELLSESRKFRIVTHWHGWQAKDFKIERR